MSTAIENHTTAYAESYAQHEALVPARLRPLMKSAFARFTDLGFPTLRDEAWRFTNVTPIARTEFAPASDDTARVTPEQIARFRIGTNDESLLVFVNGHFAKHLSRVGKLPMGVSAVSLRAAMVGNHPGIERHLARHADGRENAFAALNTAFLHDGAFVWIPRGTVAEAPIHLLYVTTPGAQPTVAHPRNLIVADANAQFSIVEQYAALDDGVYFNNAVTELVAGENVVGHHCKVVRESDRAYHVATVQLQLGPDSNVSSHGVSLGGAIVRNDINAVLDGEGAHCDLHGLYIPRGTQLMDNHLRVDHAQPHGSSRELFRGILNDRARGVFCGRIIVRPGAQKTDAKQTNKNLLLSEQAQADTKPQLEIFADDVKCTHGATIGQVDEEAIFYLRSRGIEEDAARSLLVYAFARESLAHVQLEPLRAQLEQLVLQRLPNGDSLEGTV